VADVKNILVATDFGPAAKAALAYGRDLALRYHATLHVVHVVKDLRASAAVDAPAEEYVRLQAELEEKARAALAALLESDASGMDVRGVVLRSTRPAPAILEYAGKASIDLIVLGTHGHAAFADFFFGSTAQKVVRSASCPVLTVRVPEGAAAHAMP